jgi:hypothetical protein
MELDPAYCDIAVRRWEMATGKKTRLEEGAAMCVELERERS